MKNWLKFLSIFFVCLALVLVVIIGWSAYSPFRSIESQAEDAVIQNKQLKEVSESYVYNGTSSYVTVIGKDSKNKDKAIFVLQDQVNQKGPALKMKNGISAEEAVEIAKKKDPNMKRVLHTKLGLEKPGAVWEITYKTKNDKLNYVYITYTSGNWWKRITNL
ncbi:hypothetical protein QI30_09485 [Kurthia sp. 3B1D]|uniref:Uncharacterized protein n=1 Tax=Candidatus Kurthia intestinigallinarum TaxID=1562256 RepID=A0A433RSP0_9BACL|nr:MULTISPECIES: DUF5590 domain-containing protein [unclassified Kurthia]RUS55173.1 hypothetical protein QI30_09485 [Kurthia sp. 3B1D]HIX42938.1 DUF5590 domain-containing protein [Candidatus Kurthia intestinigallinarum]